MPAITVDGTLGAASHGPTGPDSNGCEDCLRVGGQWVHLRMCTSCGHVGCCDNSPNRHATAHFTSEHHPIVLDDLAFALDDAPSFAHP